LITRVLSALVLVVVVGGTIGWLPPVATLILAVIAAGAAGVELCGCPGRKTRSRRRCCRASAGATVVAVAAPVCGLTSAATCLLAMIIGVTLASALFVLATTRPGLACCPRWRPC
jgi:hypothetical protein